ncbi:hypothetical protein ABK040_008133 [Willaertia magna]
MKFYLLSVYLLLFLFFTTNVSRIECTNILLTKQYPFCFTENLSPNTPLALHFTAPDIRQSAGEFISIKITDPFGYTLKEEHVSQTTKQTYHLKAKEDISGEYKICFTFYPSDLRAIYLDVKVEVDFDHHESQQVEKQDRIERLNDLLSNLKEQIRMIGDEQSYFKTREERFRQTTDSTYTRTFWMGAVKFLLISVLTVWQIMNLRTFFKKKKLI